ncbi:MAG: glycosyltransferase family 2 protein [bacterium]
MAQVSIGLPVFNGETYLQVALDSLLVQTYTDFELIISDNGSSDRTQEICREYASNDRRIRYYRNERNQGAAWNYNHVFHLSSGKYFKWAAHDDMCAPTFLEKCVEKLEENPAIVLCYPKTIIIDEGGNHVKPYFDNLSLTATKPSERFKYFHRSLRRVGERNAIFGLIRADILKESALIGSYVSSDTILLGELALRGEFFEVPEYLFFRRDHSQTSVNANPEPNKRVVWFDIQKKDNILLPTWRWFYEYICSIMRVQLRGLERISCFIEMGKWFKRHFKGLIVDLETAGKQLLNRTIHRYRSLSAN